MLQFFGIAPQAASYTQTLTDDELIAIRNGLLAAPIVIDNISESDTNFKIEFSFESAYGPMNVSQVSSPDNQMKTQKEVPIIGTATINSNSFAKNSDSIITIPFTDNIDNAVINNFVINGQTVLVDSSSTPSSIKIVQNVSNIASSTPLDFSYVITSYTYNNGFENVTIDLSAAPIIFNYSVQKTTPTAEISNVVRQTNSVIFDVAVQDPDNTITTDIVTAVLYNVNTTTPVISITDLDKAGELQVSIGTTLAGALAYDLYIDATYDLADGNTYADLPISPVSLVPEFGVITITDQMGSSAVQVGNQISTALIKDNSSTNLVIQNIGSTGPMSSGTLSYTYDDYNFGNGADSDGTTVQYFIFSDTELTFVPTKPGKYVLSNSDFNYNGTDITGNGQTLTLYVFSEFETGLMSLGEGTITHSSFGISTPGELLLIDSSIAIMGNAGFHLLNDLDLKTNYDYDGPATAANTKTIGGTYSGYFDGQGYSIIGASS